MGGGGGGAEDVGPPCGGGWMGKRQGVDEKLAVTTAADAGASANLGPFVTRVGCALDRFALQSGLMVARNQILAIAWAA